MTPAATSTRCCGRTARPPTWARSAAAGHRSGDQQFQPGRWLGATGTDADHGFFYSNGKMTDLGLNFFPAAVNDNGVVVGGDLMYSGGTLQNLNGLIPVPDPVREPDQR